MAIWKDNQTQPWIKASELYESKVIGLTSLEEKFNDILKKNIKSDSYFKLNRVYSGTKVDAREIFTPENEGADAEALKKELEKKKRRKKSKKELFAPLKKGSLSKDHPRKNRLLSERFQNLNFIHKDNRYILKMVDFT